MFKIIEILYYTRTTYHIFDSNTKSFHTTYFNDDSNKKLNDILFLSGIKVKKILPTIYNDMGDLEKLEHYIPIPKKLNTFFKRIIETMEEL